MNLQRSITVRRLARIENLTSLREPVIAAAEKFGLSSDMISKVDLVLEEILMNIINHAYAQNNAGMVTIELGCDDHKRFCIKSIDHGIPFDPTKSIPPTMDRNVEEPPVGGLGILLISRMTDSISYKRKNGSNELLVTFNPQRDDDKA